MEKLRRRRSPSKKSSDLGWVFFAVSFVNLKCILHGPEMSSFYCVRLKKPQKGQETRKGDRR